MHFLSLLVKPAEPLSTLVPLVPYNFSSMLAGPMFENDVSSATMSDQTVCSGHSGQKTAQLTGERVVCNVLFTSLINIFMNAIFSQRGII